MIKKDALIGKLIVPSGTKISLKQDYDPCYTLPGLSKQEAQTRLQAGIQLLSELQDKLYAQNTYAVLIVLQAMDAAGKDGIIKHVMSGLNPQGCQVYSFKTPSTEELDHDYLWRCFKALPERGRIGIFNRSYYEEVLVTRVHPELLAHEQLPKKTKGDNIWKQRFEEINNFEKYLVNNGIIVLKFFLHVSKEEQTKRFLERIKLPQKNWKFSAGDIKERAYWDKYMRAYEDCFNHTSSKWAPWFIVPANHKPTTRLAVAYVICEKLKELKLSYPTVSTTHKKQLLEAIELLESEP